MWRHYDALYVKTVKNKQTNKQKTKKKKKQTHTHTHTPPHTHPPNTHTQRNGVSFFARELFETSDFYRVCGNNF